MTQNVAGMVNKPRGKPQLNQESDPWMMRSIKMTGMQIE